MRNDIIVDTLRGVDIVETCKSGGIVLEVYEVFFCHNLEYNPYLELLHDMFDNRSLFKPQGKNLLRNLI